MGLQRRTIQKLLREDFPAATPLVVLAPEREKVGADFKARLERFDGVDTKDYGWAREEEKPRLVCSFSTIDPDSYNYYRGRDSFLLLLDEQALLTIREARFGDAALVSDPFG